MKIFLIAMLCMSTSVFAQESAIPAYLLKARELVKNVKPENNHYSHSDTRVQLPSEKNSEAPYMMNADCSSLVLHLLDQSGYASSRLMNYFPESKRHNRFRSEDLKYSIDHGHGFKKIDTLQAIQLGDVIAISFDTYADKLKAKNTGHTMLIDSLPKRIEPYAPLVENTQQYEVEIIDSSESYHGPDDTRLSDPKAKQHGIGHAKIRFYVDSESHIVGMANTFAQKNKFQSWDSRFKSEMAPRSAAIGRPIQ